jgi:ribosomal protein L36
LIGFIGGKKFEHRTIFIINSEAGYSLASIGGKNPHGFSRNTGQRGKKIGKRHGVIVIINDKTVTVRGEFGFHSVGLKVRAGWKIPAARISIKNHHCKIVRCVCCHRNLHFMHVTDNPV